MSSCLAQPQLTWRVIYRRVQTTLNGNEVGGKLSIWGENLWENCKKMQKKYLPNFIFIDFLDILSTKRSEMFSKHFLISSTKYFNLTKLKKICILTDVNLPIHRRKKNANNYFPLQIEESKRVVNPIEAEIEIKSYFSIEKALKLTHEWWHCVVPKDKSHHWKE